MQYQQGLVTPDPAGPLLSGLILRIFLNLVLNKDTLSSPALPQLPPAT